MTSNPRPPLLARKISLRSFHHNAVRQDARVAEAAGLQPQLHYAFLSNHPLDIRDHAVACSVQWHFAKKLRFDDIRRLARPETHGRVEYQLSGADPILFRAKFRGVENDLRLFLFQALEVSGCLFSWNVDGITTINRKHFQRIILGCAETPRRAARVW